MKTILYILSTMLIIGCSATDDTATPSTNIFDPRIPGGQIGSVTSVLNVSSLSANTSQVGKITLTWTNPISYQFTTFKVHLYRRQCNYLSDTSCKIVAPTSVLSSASGYEIYSGQLETYVDTNIVENTDYSYYIFIELNTSFSAAEVKTVATSAKTTQTFTMGSSTTFWNNYSWGYGSIPSGGVALGTMQISTSSQYWYDSVSDKIIKTPGKFALAPNGLALFYVDTEKNRVVVYVKQTSLGCAIIDNTTDTYRACIAQSFQEPFTASQVIGQPDQYSSKTCAQHFTDGTSYKTGLFVPTTSGDADYLRCLSSPSGVYYDGTNLVIADSGNNRVVVYKDFKIGEGCDPQVVYGQSNTTHCDADIFIGKKSSHDQTNYVIGTDGPATLNNPLDVLVYSSNLYIADSGNNRVVKINNYLDTGYWNCNSSTWLSSTCFFSGVFGQANAYSNTTFLDMYNSDNAIISAGMNANEIRASDIDILKRTIRNPTAIRITDSGYLLVNSYEGLSVTNTITSTPMELKSRILAFPLSKFDGTSPACNVATYSNGDCDASYVMGQIDFKTIPLWPTNSGSYYSNISYGLDLITGFDVLESKLIAVDGLTSASSYLNSLFVWNDWMNSTNAGRKYDYSIGDPAGATNPNASGQLLPDLKGIIDFKIDKVNNKVYVSDPLGNKIYEIKAY